MDARIHNIHRICIEMRKMKEKERPRISDVLRDVLRPRKLLITVLSIVVCCIICDAVSSKYPMFPLLLYGVITPAGIIIIHVFLILKRAKRGIKWIVVAALGMMIWIGPTVLLAPVLGPIGSYFYPDRLSNLGIWASASTGTCTAKNP